MTIAVLILFFCMTAALFFVLDYYFSQQTLRSWMDMSYTVTSWDKFFKVIEARFAYKKEDVEKNLRSAGIYNRRFAVIYFPAKITLGIVLIGGIFLFGEQLGLDTQQHQMISAIISLVLVVIGPDIWLDKRRKKLIRRIADRLPYVIDMMAVCVQTGMTIESSIAYLSDELKGFDKDLARMMWQVDTRAKVIGMNKALSELLEQYPSDEMNSFVYTLSQSLQYGSSIYELLTTLSANIRDVQVLLLEEKVGKLSAKMSVPLILFIMFPIVILITAPGIMRLMSNGSFL